MSEHSPSRRWRHLAVIALALLAAMVLAVVAVSLATGGAYGRRLAAIRAAGDPASIADLTPKPIPADDNAAAIIDSLNPQIEAFSKAHGAFYNTEAGKAYDAARQRSEPLPDESLAAIRAIVDQFPQLDDGLHRAAAAKGYAPLADYSGDVNKFQQGMLDRMQAFRALSRHAAWRMEALLSEDRRDEAVQQGINLLKLADHYEVEPGFNGYLAANAVRGVAIAALRDALAAGPVSQEMHAALDAELARQDVATGLGQMLRTERACAFSMVDAQATQVGGALVPVGRVLLRRQFLGVLDLYDELLSVAELNWYDANSPWRTGGPLTRPTGFGTLADLLIPPLQGSGKSHFRNIALLRALRIFNALQVYATQHGREATGLAELALPTEATIDPFTGQPLILKSIPAGRLVYSVGADGVDDGSNFKDDKDVGPGP